MKVKQFPISLLMIATLPLFAQSPKTQRAVHVQEQSAAHVAPQAIPASLKVIYSNLGTKTDLYLDTDGWSITGFNSYGGESNAFSIGMSFTPKLNSHVSQARVAIEYLGSGANQVNLSIYTDAGGIPGTLLAGPVTVANLPNYGTCCDLAIARFPPLAVSAGVQYWLVADAPTSGQGSDFTGAWDWVSKVVDFAGTNGVNGWANENALTLPAGAVLGTIP